MYNNKRNAVSKECGLFLLKKSWMESKREKREKGKGKKETKQGTFQRVYIFFFSHPRR